MGVLSETNGRLCVSQQISRPLFVVLTLPFFFTRRFSVSERCDRDPSVDGTWALFLFPKPVNVKGKVGSFGSWL